MENIEKLRKNCWDNSLDSFGYVYIFDKRASWFGSLVNWLKVFGVLVPALIGATALGGYTNDFLIYAINLAIPVTIIQFGFSILAIIYKWDDELSYSFESSQSHNAITKRFKRLAELPDENYNKVNLEYEKLEIEYMQRCQQDLKHNLKEWELRKGMRYALREFKRECEGCKTIPISMESTDCHVCGRFSLKYKIL
jgi:mobilome CxxCx(11)CxxC protein